MWRTQSIHQRSQTEYLAQAINRLDQDKDLARQADSLLTAVSTQEPLIKDSLKTKQDPQAHSEGPYMDAHLRRMLVVLYAVLEDKLHLIDIEEFRRMKGYEGEIDELEEIMKEKVSFFETFILVHDAAKVHGNDHHDRMMYTPVYQQLIDRLAKAHDLSVRDQAMLSDLICRHLEFRAFHKPNPSMAHWFVHLAHVKQYDGDDFLDLAQGCVFLDWVVGSQRLEENGKTFFDVGYLTNFFVSEHILFPQRRMEQYEQREQKKKTERNRLFQETKLDGLSLMDLLKMSPGPKFGKVLRSIHEGILGEGELPTFTPHIDRELQERITAFYNKSFAKGD